MNNLLNYRWQPCRQWVLLLSIGLKLVSLKTAPRPRPPCPYSTPQGPYCISIWRSVLETQYHSDVQQHQGALWWLVLRDAWLASKHRPLDKEKHLMARSINKSESRSLLGSLPQKDWVCSEGCFVFGLCGGGRGGWTVLTVFAVWDASSWVGSLRRFSQGLASWRKEGLLNSVAPKLPFYFLC